MEGIPKGKYAFGMVTMSEKGQIVIPKQARDVFGIKPGDKLLILGDEKFGLGIVRAENFEELARVLANYNSGDTK